MKKDINEFSGLIEMIKDYNMREIPKIIAIRKYSNKFFYGGLMHGLIENPNQLNVSDKKNICQNLYDVITLEFKDQLYPGHSHSLDGNYEYFMHLGENIIISFPNGEEYNKWIYDQIKRDNENNIEETKTR